MFYVCVLCFSLTGSVTVSLAAESSVLRVCFVFQFDGQCDYPWPRRVVFYVCVLCFSLTGSVTVSLAAESSVLCVCFVFQFDGQCDCIPGRGE